MNEVYEEHVELSDGFTFPIEVPSYHAQSLPTLVGGSLMLTAVAILLIVALYKRTWPRFSLRAMLVIVTMLCFWLA
jgi:hypothetical protein